MAGINTSALIRQKKSDKMISIANERIKGKAEMNNTEKPSITEKALMLIPLPTPVMALLMAVAVSSCCSISRRIRQNK